ncbi:unnamed protein product, partial [Musa banksii]
GISSVFNYFYCRRDHEDNSKALDLIGFHHLQPFLRSPESKLFTSRPCMFDNHLKQSSELTLPWGCLLSSWRTLFTSAASGTKGHNKAVSVATHLSAMATTTATTASYHASCRSSTCPPWLQAALADIEQRVQSLAVNIPDDPESDSFAERAENYYQKRPQLIALLHDLHHRYLYLADRYAQSLLYRHHRRTSSVPSDLDADEDTDLPDSTCSDAESSLSFQTLPAQPRPQFQGPNPAVAAADLDMIMAELVLAAVERDLVEAEGAEVERRLAESARKIELQGSLVEVLEAERMVLLGENARLGFRAAAAEEEARAVAAELGYMRRRAGELARAVVKLREDHRVCLLGRRIEGLQAQIYGLERRNRECFEAMARREKEKGEARAEVDRLREENRRLRQEAEAARARRRSGRSWWERVRRFDWAPASCAPHVRESKVPKNCFYI